MPWIRVPLWHTTKLCCASKAVGNGGSSSIFLGWTVFKFEPPLENKEVGGSNWLEFILTVGINLSKCIRIGLPSLQWLAMRTGEATISSCNAPFAQRLLPWFPARILQHLPSCSSDDARWCRFGLTTFKVHYMQTTPLTWGCIPISKWITIIAHPSFIWIMYSIYINK